VDVDEDAGNCDGFGGDGEVGRVLRPVEGICGRSHGGSRIIEMVRRALAVSATGEEDVRLFVSCIL
jgi:hypothetical protein